VVEEMMEEGLDTPIACVVAVVEERALRFAWW